MPNHPLLPCWTRRHWLGAATAGAATWAGSGCARRDDEAVRFWAMGREGEVVAELLQDFRREEPGVALRIEQLPWSAAHEKLLTAFAGDATPDLAQMGNTWLPEFVALGALEPLDALAQPAQGVDRPDYFQGIWDTNVVGGKLYGLPWYVDTRVLFYRRDLLQQAGYSEPPRSWGEWKQMLLAIKRLVGPERFAVLLPLNEYDPLVALALQQSDPLLREGGRYGNFRSAGFQRTLNFYLSMYTQQLAPPASSNEVANVWNEFGRGYFSFYITGPWNIGEFKRRLPAELQGAWMTAPLPGPAARVHRSRAGPAWPCLHDHRARQRPGRWCATCRGRPVQQRFHAMTGNLPPRRSAWLGEALQRDPYTAAFGDQLERARPVPQVPEWERIATELRVVLEAVVHGDLPAARMAEELDRRTDRILEKRRWMLDRGGLA
jgi:multiple sugar transport system substrate-binding protein